MRRIVVIFLGLGWICQFGSADAEPADFQAGFGAADITPPLGAFGKKGDSPPKSRGQSPFFPNALKDKPVFLAGFGKNRKATGVHDTLMARAVVLRQGKK